MGTFELIYKLQKLWAPDFILRLELREPYNCTWTVSMVAKSKNIVINTWSGHDLEGILEDLVRGYGPKKSEQPHQHMIGLIDDIRSVLEKYE